MKIVHINRGRIKRETQRDELRKITYRQLEQVLRDRVTKKYKSLYTEITK